jgi:hypothetical protein
VDLKIHKTNKWELFRLCHFVGTCWHVGALLAHSANNIPAAKIAAFCAKKPICWHVGAFLEKKSKNRGALMLVVINPQEIGE